MKTKILELLGSRTFWLATLTAITAVVRLYAPDNYYIEQVLAIVNTWFGAVFGVGFINGVAERIAGTKKK